MNPQSSQELGAALDAAIHEMRGPTHALGLLLLLMEREDASERARDPSLVPRARRLLGRLTQVIDEVEAISRRFTEEGPAPTPPTLP